MSDHEAANTILVPHFGRFEILQRLDKVSRKTPTSTSRNTMKKGRLPPRIQSYLWNLARFPQARVYERWKHDENRSIFTAFLVCRLVFRCLSVAAVSAAGTTM